VLFILLIGVVNMYKLHEMLSDKDKKKLNQAKKKQEKMTWRDWLDVMGTNRQRYKRVRGAIRRK
jgi:hypothetical protein